MVQRGAELDEQRSPWPDNRDPTTAVSRRCDDPSLPESSRALIQAGLSHGRAGSSAVVGSKIMAVLRFEFDGRD